MTDAQRLADVLAARYGHVKPIEGYGWQPHVLNVISCVLSLFRRYDPFVVPRVEAFLTAHPEVLTLDELRTLIASYSTPADFSRIELRYDDGRRADTLLGVADYLLDVQSEHEGMTERQRLESWAHWARPGDYLSVGVKGFGLAGFQYLRMLYGAQTTKPDVHIIRFVSDELGRPVVDDVQALYLMERAAPLAQLPLREVDGLIWEERARGLSR